ncbi:polysaccharide lyase 6 family protein [Noviherbaspirillum saxi]|nr:polysaccharide lyase 6 family protein [Noviherbaspirillum saxi]
MILLFGQAGCGGGSGSDIETPALPPPIVAPQPGNPPGGEDAPPVPPLVPTTPPEAIPTPGDTMPAVQVSNAKQLQNAINNASAGVVIRLADGSYTGPFTITRKNGRSGSPITIVAANPGGAVISGKAGFEFESASYVTLQGLKFVNQGTAVSLSSASHHVRVTGNTFALAKNSAPTKWIVIDGAGSDYNQIDHNDFGPRQGVGQMIALDQVNEQVPRHTLIEKNHFHDAVRLADNGGETIRVGLSVASMSDGFTVIQNNLFVHCDSDPEVISVKSGRNTVRFNTFIRNQGQVTARHGHNNSFYGNYLLNDGVKKDVGGFRIYGNDHKLYNNYLHKLTGNAIVLDAGSYDGGANGYTSTPNEEQLRMHWRIYRALVVNNTIVGSTTGIVIGGSKSLAPVGSIVANNIVVNTTGTLYDENMKSNTVFAGNIGFGATTGNVSRTSAEIRTVDPMLVEVDGLRKLSSNGPAHHAAVGHYPFLTDDMDGQTRTRHDVGADEYTSLPALRKPLTAEDVGPNATDAGT